MNKPLVAAFAFVFALIAGAALADGADRTAPVPNMIYPPVTTHLAVATMTSSEEPRGKRLKPSGTR
jgi:hypothetical protein